MVIIVANYHEADLYQQKIMKRLISPTESKMYAVPTEFKFLIQLTGTFLMTLPSGSGCNYD